jgi:hypothetical protein
MKTRIGLVVACIILLAAAFIYLQHSVFVRAQQSTAGSLTGVCIPGLNPRVELSWTPVNGATANSIQRGYNQGGSYWEFIFGEPAPFTTYSYTDTAIEPNRRYEYRVKYDPMIPSPSFWCDTTLPSEHYECRNNACTLVEGSGQNTCSSNADCEPLVVFHYECRNNACTSVEGSGQNTCSSNADCAPEVAFHYECQNSACVMVDGPGNNSCSADSDCRESTHRECQNQACVVVNGPGANQCNTNSQCITPTHRECRNNACVTVDGLGENQCFSDDACNGSQTATLTIQPGYAVFRVNETFSFRAYFDADGAGRIPLRDATADARWTVGDPDVATLIAPGQIRGKSIGTTEIQAAYDGIVRIASIEIREGAPVAGAKPSVQTGPAAVNSLGSVTFSGSVNPRGYQTSVWFEYGKTKSLGQSTGVESGGKSSGWASLSADVNGFESNANYFYRIAAQNAYGVSRGEIRQLNSGGNAVLMIQPTEAQAKAGETANFQVIYDPDGSGPQPSQDVSRQANWLSSNVQIASHVISGQFKGVAPGRTLVSAYYHPSGVVNTNDISNLTADAAILVNSGGASTGQGGPNIRLGGSQASETESTESSSKGWNWLVWIAIILIVAIIGVLIIWLVRKILNRV